MAQRRRRRLSAPERILTCSSAAVVLLAAACVVWAFTGEANWLSVTAVNVRTTKLPSGQRLRIVQLSDLHVDRDTALLRALPGRVNALSPDLFVFTGDAINRAESEGIFRRVVEQIHAPLGKVGVLGNHDYQFGAGVDPLAGAMTELNGAPLALGPLVLCGAGWRSPTDVSRCLRAAPTDAVRVVLFHTPDLVEDLAPLGVDLYLAGHTHGGQVRLPFYGAIVTLSKFDKKYEMGSYDVGATQLFVSRGIGFTPDEPRVRFLCRPELAVIDLVGATVTRDAGGSGGS